MCGLWGYVSRNTMSNNEIECSFILGYLSSLRGVDSTGVAAIYKKGGKKYYQVAKEVLCSPDFLTSRHRSVVDHNENRALIGHCRAATIGDVTYDNAHPFHEGDIIGCHNGTINSLRDYKSSRTDSQELFSRISKAGPKEAIQSVTGNKAYALTWIDLNDCSTFILRNNERPLFYVKTNGGVLYWASEALFLQFALARSGLIANGEIKPFEIDKLYRFPFATIEPVVTEINPTKSTIYNVETRAATNLDRKESTQATSSVSFFPNKQPNNNSPRIETKQAQRLGFPFYIESGIDSPSGTSNTREKTTKTDDKHEEKKADTSKNTTHTKQTNTLYVNRHGVIITREEYLNAIYEGCCCCNQDIKDGDSYFVYDTSDNVVCEACVKEHEMESMTTECGPYIPRYN